MNKEMHLVRLTLLISILLSSVVVADHDEEVDVTGRYLDEQGIVKPASMGVVDSAELLAELPGANLNANGLITGIAQYRGLYGDRVAVSIDGLKTVGGGPNAMDAPLSYASPLLLDNLSLERGISSVSSATESLGGHIHVAYNRGEFASDNSPTLSGSLQGNLSSNGNVSSSALRMVAASKHHKLALLAGLDDADDVNYPGGKIIPSRINRQRYDVSYAYQRGQRHILTYAGRLDTSDSGTPALPMDIRYIDTDLFGVRFSDKIASTSVDLSISYADVDHLMDNFSLRTAPNSPMSFRANRATGDGYQWRLASTTPIGVGELRLGLDGENEHHDSTITNPNAAMFEVRNFNDVTRELWGVYAQWNQSFAGDIELETGIRLNRVELSANEVSARMPAANPMMQMNVGMLAVDFNAADRTSKHNNVDAVLKLNKLVSDGLRGFVELAQKSRAPSYQELYLWLPLQATAGLADGRSYVGNTALESERSREINIGVVFRTTQHWFSPQLYYKDIDDYIQGEPSTNAVANGVATMMSGSAALEFSNVEADIYGFDANWGVKLTDTLLLDGNLSYSRGKRSDTGDKLYRLAPLNGRIGLSYQSAQWTVQLDAVLVQSQKRVSAFNNERQSAGYGLANLKVDWQPRADLIITAGIDNVFDKHYQNHLSGTNRVASVDLAQGERLPGLERNITAGFRLSW